MAPPKLFLILCALPFLLAADLAGLQQQVLGSVQKFLSLGNVGSIPEVVLAQAKVQGKYLDDGFPVTVEAFLGLRYAEAATGERRFAKAVPIEKGNGTIEATEFGARCPGKQLLPPGGGPDVWSEDCLTVNVFRPKDLPTDKKVPVMVYVHGGAFNRGTAKMHNTASMLAWSSEPFVAVSFNYRIGALGFLNSKLTQKEGLLNLGLWDQVLLLEWVQENIEAFGGDKGDVTLVGLSAGAHSIGHHIMNIKTEKQLFHRAVIESGGPTSRAVHPFESDLHETQFQELLIEAGCTGLSDSEILPCLRSVSETKIVEASNTVFAKWNPSVRWAWQPVMDDELISRRPLEAWKSGSWNKVPILTGFNHNEGTMYVPKTTSTSEDFENFFATLLPQLSNADLDEIVSLYPDPAIDVESPYMETRNISVGPQYKRLEAAYGHYAYVCPVRQTAILGSAEANPPIYLYHWALNRTVLGGANHGDQMWYETFDPSVTEISETQKEVAGTFHGYITSFVLSGDPNKVKGRSGARPEWKAFGNDKETMVFGKGNNERAGGENKGVTAQLVKDTWAEKECEFWWTQSGNPED